MRVVRPPVAVRARASGVPRAQSRRYACTPARFRSIGCLSRSEHSARPRAGGQRRLVYVPLIRRSAADACPAHAGAQEQLVRAGVTALMQFGAVAAVLSSELGTCGLHLRDSSPHRWFAHVGDFDAGGRWPPPGVLEDLAIQVPKAGCFGGLRLYLSASGCAECKRGMPPPLRGAPGLGLAAQAQRPWATNQRSQMAHAHPCTGDAGAIGRGDNDPTGCFGGGQVCDGALGTCVGGCRACGVIGAPWGRGLLRWRWQC